jgi:hypothetical protein
MAQSVHIDNILSVCRTKTQLALHMFPRLSHNLRLFKVSLCNVGTAQDHTLLIIVLMQMDKVCDSILS